MKIGVIGTGKIGSAFARHAAKAGYDIIVSNSRGPDSLAEVVSNLGSNAKAGTILDAAKADVVFVAVPWSVLPQVLQGLPAWGGRIVIDPTNAYVPPGFTIADLGGRTSSEIVADMVPGARVVKAANTLLAALLAADPHVAGGRRLIVMSGDDAEAKRVVAGIFSKAGFSTLDLGGLVAGGRLQQVPGGVFPQKNFIELS